MLVVAPTPGWYEGSHGKHHGSEGAAAAAAFQIFGPQSEAAGIILDHLYVRVRGAWWGSSVANAAILSPDDADHNGILSRAENRKLMADYLAASREYTPRVVEATMAAGTQLGLKMACALPPPPCRSQPPYR